MAGVKFFGRGLVVIPGKAKPIEFVGTDLKCEGVYETDDPGEIAALAKKYRYEGELSKIEESKADDEAPAVPKPRKPRKEANNADGKGNGV